MLVDLLQNEPSVHQGILKAGGGFLLNIGAVFEIQDIHKLCTDYLKQLKTDPYLNSGQSNLSFFLKPLNSLKS